MLEVWNLQRCCFINFLGNVYIPIVPPADAPDLTPVLAWTRAGTSWKMKTIDHCISVSTPTNTFEAPWQRRDVWWPPPRCLGSWGWVVFTLLLCYHGWVWFLVSTWFKPKKWWFKPTSQAVYCAWLKGRGACVYRDTPVHLYWASPDCMNGQTTTLWTVQCVWLQACTCVFVRGEWENIL